MTYTSDRISLSKYKQHFLLGLLFFIFNYTLATVNNNFMCLIYNHFNEKQSLCFIRLSLLPLAVSLFVFGLWCSRAKPSISSHSRITGTVTVFTTVLFLPLFLTTNKYIFLISEFVFQFAIGFLCVYYYRLMYRAFASLSHMGIVFSLSMIVSFLLQYLLQPGKDYNLTVYSLILCSFIAAFIDLSGLTESILDLEDGERIITRAPHKRSFIRTLVCLMLAIMFFELIGNFLTDSLIRLIPTYGSMAFAVPRLFTIPAYLIVGLVADIKDMKYIPLLTLSGVLIGILNPVLFNESSSYFFNACIFYAVAGFINAFLVLIMLKQAWTSSYAPLVAVSGRITDSIFSCVFTSSFISKLPVHASITIELVCFAFVILLFTFSGQLTINDDTKYTMKHMPPDEFAKSYNFTEKETELFGTILTFEGNMSELARSLYISRSVLYRTLGNICEKTGCTSLQAVKTLYYDTPDTPVKEETVIEDQPSPVISLREKLIFFSDKYNLSEKESATLKTYLEHPDKTQQELADLMGTTLRTVQRHLSGIRKKTETKSMAQLNKLFYDN